MEESDTHLLSASDITFHHPDNKRDDQSNKHDFKRDQGTHLQAHNSPASYVSKPTHKSAER